MKKDNNSNSAIPIEATCDDLNSAYTDQIKTIINGIKHYTHITLALDKIVPILNNIKLSSNKSYYTVLSSYVGMKLLNIVINDINKFSPFNNTITDMVCVRETIILISTSIDLDAACIKHMENINEVHVKKMTEKKIIFISIASAILSCTCFWYICFFQSDTHSSMSLWYILYFLNMSYLCYNTCKIYITVMEK